MTLTRRALTLLASVGLSLALAGPTFGSNANGGLPGWACSSDDRSARGQVVDSRGQVREKDTGQIPKDLPARARGQASADLEVTVRVWFHVITDGTTGAVSNADIASQIEKLNEGFGGAEGGWETGFSFELAGVTRTDNARWFSSRNGGVEHAMKRALKRGGDATLNVYSTSGGPYLGWAYLPEITDTAQRYLDGIVIDWQTMPGVSDAYAGRFDGGDTLVHEAGHWLNLEHTFFGQCNAHGDFVDDTPAERHPASGCPEGSDTCRKPGSDPIHNYMDYSDDPCITEFTSGQAQRMRDAWLFWRAP